MELANVLAIAAVAIAVVAIPVTVWATRNWGNRRGRILFSCDAQALMPETVGTAERTNLQLTFRNIPVPDPYLATITIFNGGPRDIASSHFDDGQSLVVDLQAKMYGVVSADPPRGIASGAIGGEARIEIRPRLLKRGDVVTVKAIVSGTPSPKFYAPLIDVDVVSGPTQRAEFLEAVADATAASLPWSRILTIAAMSIAMGGAKRS